MNANMPMIFAFFLPTYGESITRVKASEPGARTPRW